MKKVVSEVQIVPIKPKDGLIAFASCLLFETLYISSIGVHSRLDGTGYRLTYPTKRVGDRDLNLYHPVTKYLSKAIEEAVFTKLKEVTEKSNDRYHCSYATTA
jgi:stage V sporulation protein G